MTVALSLLCSQASCPLNEDGTCLDGFDDPSECPNVGGPVSDNSASSALSDDLSDLEFDRNGVDHDDLISIWFTVTEDLCSAFPATGARSIGLGDVPLLCAQELDIVGATSRCVRILMHLESDRSRAELHHVYVEHAVSLRDDLPS